MEPIPILTLAVLHHKAATIYLLEYKLDHGQLVYCYNNLAKALNYYQQSAIHFQDDLYPTKLINMAQSYSHQLKPTLGGLELGMQAADCYFQHYKSVGLDKDLET